MFGGKDLELPVGGSKYQIQKLLAFFLSHKCQLVPVMYFMCLFVFMGGLSSSTGSTSVVS